MNRTSANLAIDIMKYKYAHRLLFPVTDDMRPDFKERTLYSVDGNVLGTPPTINGVELNYRTKYNEFIDEYITICYGTKVFESIEEAKIIVNAYIELNELGGFSEDTEKAIRDIARKYHNPFYDIIDMIEMSNL